MTLVIKLESKHFNIYQELTDPPSHKLFLFVRKLGVIDCFKPS